MRTRSIAMLIACVALAWTTSPARAADAPRPTPTFAADVAAILHANCAACHRDGEAGPFPLLTYADAKKRAAQIAAVTGSRFMPPWKPAHGAGEFLGARRLTDAQIDVLKRWADSGAPEGDAAAVPAPPPAASSDGWQLGTPDLIVKMPQPFDVPADGRDVYRCFAVPVAIPPGKFLRAVEYRPGNRRVVHHAVLTTLNRKEAARRLVADGDATGPGFRSGLAAPGDRLPGPLGIWVPGLDPLALPAGYAMAWPGDVELILQLHLHPIGRAETEQSSLGLHFTDERPRDRILPVTLFNKNVDIAPGDKLYRLEKSLTLPKAVDVMGVFPHMHLLGRTVTATATLPDGTVRPLLTIDDWDFRWQGYYLYRKPMRLPAGTRLEARWTFDNSAGNARNPSTPPARVRFGEQTKDEMGALVLDVVPATDDAQANRP